jgi:hypothetical protein
VKGLSAKAFKLSKKQGESGVKVQGTGYRVQGTLPYVLYLPTSHISYLQSSLFSMPHAPCSML